MKILIASLLIGSVAYAQAPPQGVPPANNTNSRAAAWYRGGNNAIGTNPTTANIFGTMAGFNSPIYTYTAGQPRTVVNGFTINCFTLQPLYGVAIILPFYYLVAKWQSNFFPYF